MKIGFGTTVLEKGLSQGHMDGIGVYAKNLWEQFDTTGQNIISKKQALSFGQYSASLEAFGLLGEIMHLPPSYPIQSARSIISGKPFLGVNALEAEIDLFFAPDHHIPKLNHTPVVATIMDAYPLVYPKLVSRRLRRFKNIAFKRASHWASHIITISEHSKQDIIQYFEIPEEMISVIPLGVNKAFFQTIPENEREAIRQKFSLKGEFFIFVGTIQPRKNLSRLIEAYLLLPSILRQKHPLVIIGHYGWGEDALQQKLDALGENDTIHHLKNVTDRELYALLQSALAMVYPSLYEGFGLPVLEGFASKIPVITSKTTSIPEVAAEAALYINPLDSTTIADGMQLIASDESLRKSLICKGSQRAAQYSWKNSAELHIKCFNNILQ
ncbi:MAG: glycosyltransferase family 1 protein [Campylobacterota bacterium]|nr:glycosyltransferase family 1 protein [Campylobacterota bacterium]